MVDILNVDTNYQLLIAEFNSMHNDIGLVLPGVHFSLMIDLESSSDNPVYTAGFLMNLLSNLSNIDFNLYCGTQAQKKSLLPGVPMNVCTFPGFADLKPTDMNCAVSTQSYQAPALSINHILLSS